MMLRHLGWHAALVALIALPSVAAAQSDQTFNPADYVAPNVCPTHYNNNAGVCEPDTVAINKLSKDLCTPEPLKFEDSKGCQPGDGKVTAQCRSLPGYAAKLNAGKCEYTRVVPTSGRGNYVGDCLRITAIPPGVKLTKGQHFVVTDQRKSADDSDTLLTVAEARPRNLFFLPGVTFTCGIEEGRVTRELSANTLTSAGARRYGWTYGLLTVPFKYYGKEDGFTSSVQLGPYLGYRWGEAGSAWTLAGGFALGSVKANTIDAGIAFVDGKPVAVTGTTDVAAVSSTVGLMFDVWKSPGARPFKIGIFYGSDRISKEPTIFYKYNKRPWVAFQIGFDFTDG